MVVAFVRLAGNWTRLPAWPWRRRRLARLSWIAYPKAGRLGTDLNRDRLAGLLGRA